LAHYATSDHHQPGLHGRALRQARLQAGFTLKALSQASGVHHNSICDIENGRVVAKSATLQKLADGLGRSLEDILGPKPIPQPGEEAIVASLLSFRERNPQLFDGWSEEHWQRYKELCVRHEAFTDGPAGLIARRVSKEFRYIEQLRDLLDADEESRVVAALVSEHDRWRNGKAATGEGRIDPAHLLPALHRAVSLATP